MHLRNAVLVAGAVALFAFLVLVRPTDYSDGGKRTVVQIWHPRGGTNLDAYVDSVKQFEKDNPDIRCKLLYVPNDLSNSQKFYTSVIGNCAPEVTFVDGPQVAEWAEKGLLLPLDDLLREAGRPPEKLKHEFFEPCWKQCEYRGHVYAITFCADPNFCFFWNKKAIRDVIAAGEIPAGTIDPEKAPATLEELDRWNDAVTKVRDTGAGKQLERIGLVPWGVYGHANSIFTWGWAFGGSFYDEKTGRVTADDPRIVQALEWMCQYERKYGHERVATLQSSFGSAEQNPFIVGKQVIQLLHISGLHDLQKFAPDLEYGMAPIPQPTGGEYNSSWVGGWTLAIPNGVTDRVQQRAALRYILWACAEEGGTKLSVRTTGDFPGWHAGSFFKEACKDPHKAVFAEILKNCKHQRPVMPAQAFFMDELSRAVDKVIRNSKKPDGTPWTAKEALAEASRRTQQHLDRMLRERELQLGKKECK